MTWNIHGGIGSDGRCDLFRIAARIRLHKPDIVALQEVDSRRKSDAGDAFLFFAESLGVHSAEARIISAADGDYGHVVISAWPMAAIRRHDISVRGREPRAAIEGMVETPWGPLHVVAAHLGLSLHERHRQAATLASLAKSAATPTVMLGDFNDWLWHGSVQRSLAKLLPGRTRHRTFPAILPLFTLDRIYCRPACILARSWTDPDAKDASDHLPVIADLRFEGR